MAREISGVVVVDKPSGPTSFDVVRRVKGLYKTRRCGHTGTLDPTATGVLPICIGDATKIASFVSDGEKEYDALSASARSPIRRTPPGARGDAAHRGPHGSGCGRRSAIRRPGGADAAHVLGAQGRGTRLYELARAGEEVEREARQVHIDEARLIFFRSPDAGIFVRCSKGTYCARSPTTWGRARVRWAPAELKRCG